jgi:hypothetical protein
MRPILLSGHVRALFHRPPIHTPQKLTPAAGESSDPSQVRTPSGFSKETDRTQRLTRSAGSARRATLSSPFPRITTPADGGHTTVSASVSTRATRVLSGPSTSTRAPSCSQPAAPTTPSDSGRSRPASCSRHGSSAPPSSASSSTRTAANCSVSPRSARASSAQSSSTTSTRTPRASRPARSRCASSSTTFPRSQSPASRPAPDTSSLATRTAPSPSGTQRLARSTSAPTPTRTA